MRLEKPRLSPPGGRPSAQKRPVSRPKPGPRIPPPSRAEVFVLVDYPQAGERVTSPSYTIRLTALSGGDAEVSIDDEAWMSCREASGHWWLDWSGYGRGTHKVCARITLPDGRRSLSACRTFSVEPG